MKLNLPSENAVVVVVSVPAGVLAAFFRCPAAALFFELLSSDLDEDFDVGGACEIICAICLLASFAPSVDGAV